MSPRVQLVLYPDGDSAFASTTTMSLQIELPDHYDPEQVLGAIQKHLRADYPLAIIRAEPSDCGGGTRLSLGEVGARGRAGTDETRPSGRWQSVDEDEHPERVRKALQLLLAPRLEAQFSVLHEASRAR